MISNIKNSLSTNNIFHKVEVYLYILIFFFLPLSTFKLLRIEIFFFKLPISILLILLILVVKSLIILQKGSVRLLSNQYNEIFLFSMLSLLLMLVLNIYPYLYNTIDITYAIKSIVRLSVSLMVFIVISYFLPNNNSFIDSMLSIFIISSSLFIGLIIYKHLKYSVPFLSATWDISSSVGITKAGKNSLGFYLSVTSSIIFWKFIFKRKNLIWIFPLLIHLFAMVYAQSRSAWLTFIISLILVVLIFKNRFKKNNISPKTYLKPILFVVLCSFFSFSFFLSDDTKEALKIRYELINSITQGSISSKDKSANERVDMIKKSIKIFEDSPIFGVGTYLYPYSNVGEDFISIYGKVSHNDYAMVLSEQGIVGFFILSFMLIQLFRAMLSISYMGWKNIAFSQAVIIIVLQMLFLDPLYFSFSYIIFGLFFSINKYKSNKLNFFNIKI